MKLKVPALLALVLGMLFPFRSEASHISGAEIYWECLGNDEYFITMVVYRDCDGIPVSQTETIEFDSPCGTATLSVSHGGATEISQLCDFDLPNSTCNGGFLPGIEQYVYTGTVTLPPCDTWTMSWDNCCRNDAIANLNNPASQDMYVFATLNNVLAPCDNSPQFTNEPIPYVCLNFPVSYSYGAFDIDADSISYELIEAMDLGGVPLTYVPPFTGNEPIAGLTWDPLTGLVNFTLTQAGNWVVVMQVTSWDTSVDPPQIIGTVMRDMQFVGYPCTNQPPNPADGGPESGAITNFQGNGTVQVGDYAVEMCETDQFCFDMIIGDPDVGDTLAAVTNVLQNLPGATFSYTGVNPITATVCWTATPGSSGFYPFIVTVSDDACPIVGFNTYVYSVNVLQRTSAGPDQTICGDQVANLDANGGSLFTWSVLAGDPIQVGVNFSCNPCENPIADPDNTTTYIVTSDLSGSCINADTVTVFVVPDFSFQVTQEDTVLCLGETIQFNTTVNPNTPGYIYEWTPPDFLSDPTIGNPVGTYNQPGSYEYLVEITSPDGCVKLDTTITVIVTPGYNPLISVSQLDEFVCEGESTEFNVELDCSVPGFCGLYSGPCCGPLTTADVGTDVMAGTTTSYPAPFGHFYEGARHQILYRASELQALGFSGGKINELGFEISQLNGTTQYFEWEVKMGCTTLDEFTPGQQWITGLTSVYYEDTLNIQAGWNLFQFPTSFNWDGVSNLIVEVCFNNDPYLPTWTQNSPTFYTTTPYNSVLYRNQDANPNICSDFTFTSISDDRPNTRLLFCGGVDASQLEYTWSPCIGLDDCNSPNPTVTPQSSPVTYTVTVNETGSGCETTADVTVGWWPPADVSFIPVPDEGVVQLGPFFDNTSGSNVSNFTWDFGDGVGSSNDFEPSYVYNTPGIYVVTLTGVSVNGCLGFYVDTVIVLDQPIVAIPNVFSPNGDGSNDGFAFLDFRGFDTFTFKVFNRWGQLIYETRSLRDAGNNTVWQPNNDVPDGTYYYVFNGTGKNGDMIDRSGHITLVR